MGTLLLTFELLPAVLNQLTLKKTAQTDTTRIVIGCEGEPSLKGAVGCCELPRSTALLYIHALGKVFAGTRS